MTDNLIRRITIRNFKSIESSTIDLGLINVFIGENGAGKSNVLEAIAFAGAAAANKIDNEFLAARGMRLTDTRFMRPAFEQKSNKSPIEIEVSDDESESSQNKLRYTIENDNDSYPEWKYAVSRFPSKSEFTEDSFVKVQISPGGLDRAIRESHKDNIHQLNWFRKLLRETRDGGISIQLESGEEFPSFFTTNEFEKLNRDLSRFVIYSPENSSLRTFAPEGQMLPLGINGEGLLRFLAFLDKQNGHKEIKSGLNLFSWFSDMSLSKDGVRDFLRIYDRFLPKDDISFDQQSASEGFLFVAFYLALFSSYITPTFFAIDNIDASLNPRLCEELMKRLSTLAKKKKKQAIFTTHNPSILDGLNIRDTDQRLFIVSRNRMGRTVVKRFDKELNFEEKRLSELFIRGLLGGVPKGF